MTIVLQQLVLGVLIGGLYGLAAAGLSLIFGVMKVLNVAHGELIMLGGYGAFWLFALSGLDPFAALVVVIPVALAGGALLYWGLFGWVVRYHEETRIKNSLLIGFGLGLALHAAADDWEAALMTGIDVRRAYLLAFAIGTALAGAAGTLVSVGY